MIVLRLGHGIKQHFPQRVSEWIMGGGMLAWSLVLAIDPTTFDSPSFATLGSLATQETWSSICMIVALIRLSALVINGSFHSFRFAPHLRAFASACSCFFWGQIMLAITAAWIWQDGKGTGVVAYGILMAFELWNFFRASADVGASRKNPRNARTV